MNWKNEDLNLAIPWIECSAGTLWVCPALKDNYFYFIEPKSQSKILIFDPGTATPFKIWIQQHASSESISKKPAAVFLTHQHHDHIGGLEELIKTYNPEIFSSQVDQNRIPGVLRGLKDDESIEKLGIVIKAIEIPGHTHGLIAFYLPQFEAVLCSDGIFSYGCGRLFEGTALESFQSLEKLKKLPAQTQLLWAHNYHESNFQFCSEYFNSIGATKKRVFKKASFDLGATLAQETLTNPFLNFSWAADSKSPSLKSETSPIGFFTALRKLRDQWSPRLFI